MKRTSFAGMECSVAQALELVGDWWTLLVIRDAMLGVRRFEQFQRRLGIARNVLSDRLEKLVESGILARRNYQEHPPRHEYRLTEMGLDLYPVIVSLRQWGDRWAQPGDPPVVVEHLQCRQVTHGRLVCSHCGEPLTALNVRARGRLVPVREEVPEPAA